MTSYKDCQQAVAEINQLLTDIVENNRKNRQLMQGIIKFKKRLAKSKHQPSKLASNLHLFGSVPKYRKTLTMMKKGGGKIPVQPEALKRRKKVNGGKTNGSKNAIVKGMVKKHNPFDNIKVTTKRPHKLSANVESNVPAPKKSGASKMGSKTKLVTKTNSKNKQASKH